MSTVFTPIQAFYLQNCGGFVACPGCNFIDPGVQSGSWGGNLYSPNGAYYNPGDHGVPAGALVQLTIQVEGGDDRTTDQFYTYDPSANAAAHYSITGTVQASNVHDNGVQPMTMEAVN